MRGVVAAGHPITAEAGAQVLREGGNAVDAAIAAMLTSWVAEPLLTGPGAGGYMLVAAPGSDPVLLDFFVEVPGRGVDPAQREPLEPVDVSFGDATQMFNIGASSVGVYGNPAGICAAADRFGTVPLAELTGRAARLAREGVSLTPMQAYVFEILAPILVSTDEAASLFCRDGGGVLRAGDPFRDPRLGDTLERLGAEGAAPFYGGDLGAAAVDWVRERGGMLTREDLSSYSAIVREPVRVRYRDRDVLVNPPPNAGGILLAYALALLEREAGTPSSVQLAEVMRRAQHERTPEFVAGLPEPGFPDEFLASRLGSTTHISVLDADGWACAVTCSNGEGSAQVVPGTGIHLNNMLGEQDLNPYGYFTYPPGRRLPSMMAPTIVLRDGSPELVLGSAGSNRIRAAILQVIVGVVDRRLPATEAVEAPRLHWEDSVVYLEPGLDEQSLEDAGFTLARFRAQNLFFGGVQLVERDLVSGAITGAGDPRRGGAAVAA
jgi:gamma-glutamyltranspeptidase/glutathione hydrolase